MKEKPIIFSGPMVRAILEGRKTQTRRVMKPKPISCGDGSIYYPDRSASRWKHYVSEGHFIRGVAFDFSPYGQPGERLWVKETWCQVEDMVSSASVYYRADGEDIPGPWKPSIYMPRRFSRILLEITNVRVERLREISEADAKSEGVEWLFSDKEINARPEFGGGERNYKNYLWHGLFGQCGMGNKTSDQWQHQFSGYRNAIGSFSSLWESLHGPDSWNVNPWVWVIEFKRLEARA